MDEIEAAPDDVNVYRYADYLKKFTKHTQFLVITHRKNDGSSRYSVWNNNEGKWNIKTFINEIKIENL